MTTQQQSNAVERVQCSFCERNEPEVGLLIKGPRGYICDECVELCNTIIQDRNKALGSGPKDL